MKKIILSFLFLLIIILNSFTESKEEYYYNLIMKKTFDNEKTPYTKLLGKLKTEKAKEILLDLLKDPSMWNNKAAVNGIIELEDDEADKILINEFYDNIILKSDIEKIIKLYPDRFTKYLIEKIEVLSSENDIKKTLKLIAEAKTKEGEIFLKKLFNDKTYQYNYIAFEHFVLNYKKSNYIYIKQYIDNPKYKEYVLSCIIEMGNKEDLDIFLQFLESSKIDNKYIILAYEAVNKWGDEKLKIKTYLTALKEKDEVLVEGSLYTFVNTQSEDIKKQLGKLIKKAAYQNTRITAAEQLVQYKTKDIIPLAVPVLNENYIGGSNFSAIDTFLSVLTLGFTAILQNYNQKQLKKNFNARLSSIANSFSIISGYKYGNNYTKWFDWSIYNGYTINGINIIQYLFSGYQLKRKNALLSSYYLLGYKNEKDFLKQNKDFLNYEDTEYTLKIAELLIEKGYMINEEN